MVGAATEKPLEPKQVRTRGTHSKWSCFYPMFPSTDFSRMNFDTRFSLFL